MVASQHRSERAVVLSDLLGAIRIAEGGKVIHGVQLDSRLTKPGDLFVALPGSNHDGRQFIKQAVANGAAAVVAEPPVAEFFNSATVPLIEIQDLQQEVGLIAARFYNHPSRALYMVGVTGTNGKTTTSQLIAQLGRALGKTYGVIGTLGASLAEDVTDAGNTTPDPVSLQRQLAKWRDLGVCAVSMEVSSHALTQGRVNGVEFDTAVFTNLSRDHLDYHGSMQAYGRAKKQLFTMPELRNAVVNMDDEYGAALLAEIGSEITTLTYSAKGDPAADVRMESARFYPGGVFGRLCGPWGGGDFSSPLAGDFNLSNLAAALSTLMLAGENLEALLGVVADLRPVPGRMQSVPNTVGIQVIIDYAHTPDALRQVLLALKQQVAGRLTTVFGCGGDRDKGKRALMGSIASDLSNRVVVTSDNPRGEDPGAILRDIAVGCTGDYELISDRAEAISVALNEADPGDCVLIAGKGHEDYQIVDGRRLHFSDEEQALQAFVGRAAS
ncbi:MAG: UDP-N-acetylmuramoyl-L-alanyl-D-glutamate--2,6-diaminopimelate ligase [Halieaceae bacterium]|mgnify:CR=1 FL=1|jgi:UDP-N-acetylmuramoyl-L-alanyl-D-glutamate--2,6-diaminopimelate ligase|nr:UDP-N-acetylmuramoyl-L-alanyl-D-glutamate--2,6-diaminopimelate ligase [Halieaceae bacterium]